MKGEEAVFLLRAEAYRAGQMGWGVPCFLPCSALNSSWGGDSGWSWSLEALG